MQTIIRQASISDREAIWDFIKIAYEDKAQYLIPDRWTWLYLENPFLDKDTKELPIWLAIKDGHIVGQICAFPVEIKIGNEMRRAAWGTDLVVLASCRREGLAQKLTQGIVEHYGLWMGIMMADASRRIFERFGCANIEPVSIYRRFAGLDRDSFFRLFVQKLKRRPKLYRIVSIGCRVFLIDRIFPWAVNMVFGLRDLLERRTKRESRTQIREVERFGDEIDQLWNATSHEFDVIAKRDQRFLNWRFTANTQLDYRSFIATRDGETRGYIVLRKCKPIEQHFGIIVDLFTSRDDEETLEDLIVHAIRFFGRKVVAIECAASVREYQKALSRLGFLERRKMVPIFLSTDSAVRDKLDELKSRWFLTKGDQDWDQLAPV